MRFTNSYSKFASKSSRIASTVSGALRLCSTMHCAKLSYIGVRVASSSRKRSMPPPESTRPEVDKFSTGCVNW